MRKNCKCIIKINKLLKSRHNLSAEEKTKVIDNKVLDGSCILKSADYNKEAMVSEYLLYVYQDVWALKGKIFRQKST